MYEVMDAVSGACFSKHDDEFAAVQAAVALIPSDISGVLAILALEVRFVEKGINQKIVTGEAIRTRLQELRALLNGPRQDRVCPRCYKVAPALFKISTKSRTTSKTGKLLLLGVLESGGHVAWMEDVRWFCSDYPSEAIVRAGYPYVLSNFQKPHYLN